MTGRVAGLPAACLRRIPPKFMITSKCYEYRIFNLADVLHYTSAVFPDAYFAHTTDGKSKQDWDAALSIGFRWIRTDGNLVILEREFEVVAARKLLKGQTLP